MAFQAGRDLEIYRGNYGNPAPQPGTNPNTLEGGQRPTPMQQQMPGWLSPQPRPQIPSSMPAPGGPVVQQAAEAQPEQAVSSLMAASGPNPVNADLGFSGGGAGMMRPGLPEPLSLPEDGGLRALQRKVY